MVGGGFVVATQVTFLRTNGFEKELFSSKSWFCQMEIIEFILFWLAFPSVSIGRQGERFNPNSNTRYASFSD